MKLCIAGKGNIAVDCLQFFLKVLDKKDIFVILNNNDNFKNTWMKSLGFYANLEGIKIVKLEDVYLIEDLLFLSLEFDKIINPKKFKSSNLYNIHFSLLPDYKGVYTSLLPILHGKDFSGISFHKIDNGIDTGDIIFQEKIDINNTTTCRELYFKYLINGANLIIENFNEIINGNFKSIKQNPINSFYYSRNSINILQKEINLFQSAFQIQRNVNAFIFREYQLPTINGIQINKVIILEERSKEKPGKIVFENDEKLIINTIDFNIIVIKDYYDELIKCARENNVKRAEKIIDYIPDINETEKNGWTPLIIASFYGSYDIINLILKKGALINKTNLNGTTPLMYAKELAIENDDFQCLSLLIKNNADKLKKDVWGKSIFDYLDLNKHSKLINFLNDSLSYD
ncbi:MAG: formyltransferase family protein [Bacteroidales bacterium]